MSAEQLRQRLLRQKMRDVLCPICEKCWPRGAPEIHETDCVVAPDAWHKALEDRAEPGVLVHVLYHGRPLCGFSAEVPGEWPPGHSWVSITEYERATCAGCVARVAMLAAAREAP